MSWESVYKKLTPSSVYQVENRPALDGAICMFLEAKAINIYFKEFLHWIF